ncbi:transglutaminase-like domain-containing protein [Bordetella genomosp. 12]|uniref:Uncharacterized protein n=1 Tax=Bordetella genomosp. 12 TaxID=463035 RepID=A0A261VJL8_9BORD|nr:transglutaminase-like domain-containing protein [Bordetella genomosp. 12]OZI74027.1 hypothetical protein CAL22_05875 [Bordetella genomosp. 12]
MRKLLVCAAIFFISFAAYASSLPKIADLDLGGVRLEGTERGRVAAPEDGVEYQFLMRYRPDAGEQKPEISWTPLSDYSRDGAFSVDLNGRGIYDFHIQARKSGSTEKIINAYLGQIEVTSEAALSRLTFYSSRDVKSYSVAIDDYLGIFSHKEAMAALATGPDFYKFVVDTYQPRLFPESLRELGTEALFSIHAMNTVAALYHYGNFQNKEALGCVIENESGQRIRNFSEFTRSEIGCCYDYAALLAYVLHRRGIKYEYRYIPGHVFVDAQIAGKTYTFDPTVNIAYVGGIEDAVSDRTGYLLLFPLAAAEMGNRYESADLPIFRRKLLAWLGLASVDDISKEAPSDLMAKIEAIVFADK